MKKSTLNLIITGIIMILLLFISSDFQNHLKVKPQIFMIIFSSLTLLSFFSKNKNIERTLFYIVLGSLLFISFQSITDWIIDILNPKRGIIVVDGIERRVMDMSWIWGIIIGVLLTPILLFFYNKSKIRNKKSEIILIAFFLIVTIIIFVKNELFWSEKG